MRLLLLGSGYVATALGVRLLSRAQASQTAQFSVAATARTEDKCRALEDLGFTAYRFDGATPLAAEALAGVTHILHSIPPEDETGSEPATRALASLAPSPGLQWFGYLSSTVVYGDRAGAEVSEDTPCDFATAGVRALRRLNAERHWNDWGDAHDVAVGVFRLAGIYGPGRNALLRVRDGSSRRIRRQNHYLGRIHRDDIVACLELALACPARARGIFNLVDDEPTNPAEVVEYAAALAGVDPPPLERWEDAQATLPPFTRSFYEASRRVRAHRTREVLGWSPRYPNFRTGLQSLVSEL